MYIFQLANMFENTLLIIKADYMHKRKSVLLRLLQCGFQIQTNRKLSFSPEHAAEFYQGVAEERNFMLQVILLSKGTAEAFILAKENAVDNLQQTLICYFGTSLEMERNVHVPQTPAAAQREITYIFPNYIHEPMPYFERSRFCEQPFMTSLVSELYDISQAAAEEHGPSWRVKLAEWLMLTNKTIPRITNLCATKPSARHEDKGIQARWPKNRGPSAAGGEEPGHACPSVSFSSVGSSMIMSSSSCISCSRFDGTDVLTQPPPPTKAECLQLIKAKSKQLPELKEEVPCEHGEGLRWIEHNSEDCSEDAGVAAALMDEQDFEFPSDLGEMPSNDDDAADIFVKQPVPN